MKTFVALATAANAEQTQTRTSAKLSEQLKAAEAEASNKAKAAEEAWQKSRKETDSLLAKVHSEMAALNVDLNKNAEKQKADLALLESSRQKETEALNATEKKLKDLHAHSQAAAPVVTSFMEDGEDYLAPLRKAAEAAKVFAEKIRNESSPQSLLQQGSGTRDFQAKAEHSLLQAQQALKKLDIDLAAQKEDLTREEAKAKEAEANLRAASHVSFLQTEDKEDPLSAKSLSAWREKFQAELQRAREAAGIKTPFKSSFAQIQLDNTADAKLKEDEANVARLQEIYDNQMAKLKADNSQLMVEANAEITKAREMKAKLESDMKANAGSLLQTGTHAKFDVNAEQEKIRQLQANWQASAKKLGEPSKPTEAELELNSLIEQQKTKEASAQVELEKLKHKLKKDIETLHKSLATVSDVGTSADTTPAFVQLESKNALEDMAAKFRQWLSATVDTPSTTLASGETVETTDGSVSTDDVTGEATGETVETSDGSGSTDDVTGEATGETVETTDGSGSTEATTETPDANSGMEILSEISAPSATAEADIPSFLEVNTADPAQVALEKAETDLRKLQDQLKEQMASLGSFGSPKQ